MNQLVIPEKLQELLRSEVRGTLAIDQALLDVGTPWGSWVRGTDHLSTVTSNATPLFDLPPLVAQFLGRSLEVQTVLQAILQHRSLEILGSMGVGRSSLARYLAHHPQVTTSHPDGLVYLQEPFLISEVLQILFDRRFYTYPDTCPSPSQLQVALAEQKLLIFVDIPAWTSADVQQLRQMLPNSTLMVVAEQSCLDGETLVLSGLPPSDGIALLETAIGRSIAAAERSQVEPLCQQVQGLPQALLYMATLVHEDGYSWSGLEDLLEGVTDGQIAIERLLEKVLEALGTPERWVLSLLLALDGVSLQAEQIAEMIGPRDPFPCLQRLQQRHLVKSSGKRYRLTRVVARRLRRNFTPDPWVVRILTYLLPWVEVHRQFPDRLQAELSLILFAIYAALDRRDWTAVLCLAQATETSLILTKRWESWGRVLQAALQAAHHLGDQAAIATIWHQLGTRFLCQAEIPVAYDALSQALKLRRQLGDEVGIAVTQQNLTYLMRDLLPKQRQFSPPDRPAILPFSRRRVYWVLGVLVVLTFVISFTGALWLQRSWQPWHEPDALESPTVKSGS
ncbi:MAG: hypothetical protein VKJ24_12240 [Synechococcales bacterium]|nr:hypothetical protein [Synechococcales bacterium]